MRHLGLVLLVLAVGCGGKDGGTPDPDGPGGSDGPGGGDGPAADGPAGAFALTSPAFTEGTAIPQEITCDGNDTSPQLDWTGVPAGTMSFAVVLTDTTIVNGFLHSVIYDIPANLIGLPADVEKVFDPTDVTGAHQTRNFRGGTNFGYAGPCPQNTHTYEFKLYALDVATLPGATVNTSMAQAKAAIEMHDIEATTLSGAYDPNQ